MGGGTLRNAWASMEYTVSHNSIYSIRMFFLVRPACGASFSEYPMQLISPFLLAISSVGIGYFLTLQIWNIYFRLGLALVLICFSYLVLNFYLNNKWFNDFVDILKIR